MYVFPYFLKVQYKYLVPTLSLLGRFRLYMYGYILVSTFWIFDAAVASESERAFIEAQYLSRVLPRVEQLLHDAAVHSSRVHSALLTDPRLHRLLDYPRLVDRLALLPPIDRDVRLVAVENSLAQLEREVLAATYTRYRSLTGPRRITRSTRSLDNLIR